MTITPDICMWNSDDLLFVSSDRRQRAVAFPQRNSRPSPQILQTPTILSRPHVPAALWVNSDYTNSLCAPMKTRTSCLNENDNTVMAAGLRKRSSPIHCIDPQCVTYRTGDHHQYIVLIQRLLLTGLEIIVNTLYWSSVSYLQDWRSSSIHCIDPKSLTYRIGDRRQYIVLILSVREVVSSIPDRGNIVGWVFHPDQVTGKVFSSEHAFPSKFWIYLEHCPRGEAVITGHLRLSSMR